MATSRINPLPPSIRLSPAHSRENSRSTSPERNPSSLYQKIDPLLANLSPESTLHALTSTEAVPSNEKFAHDVLSRSISQVSPAERALGIRAAIAAQNLSLWYKEVQSWTWPKQNDAMAGKGFVPPTESSTPGIAPGSSTMLAPASDSVEYYGSLPADVVEQYEQRIEEIRDGMDNLNVEELKEHVLNAHIPSRSRPSSSTSSVSVDPPLSYVQLSDFTAVVTATILRALPFLSRLSSLLSTWDVRLLVLRQIPGLLRELKSTRAALDASSQALRTHEFSANAEFVPSESHIRAEHVKLESAVVGVGRRMDRALDALEGRQDSLPEAWIDDLENLESDFAAWAVEAEKYRLRVEWLRSKEAKTAEPAEDPEKSALKTTQDAVPAASASESEPVQASVRETNEEEAMSAVPSAVEDEGASAEPAVVPSESEAQPPLASESPTPPDACMPGFVEEQSPSEREQGSLSQSNATIESETPTRSVFFPGATDSPGQSSPSRVPLPATPDAENKENIPPPGFSPQQAFLSPRELKPPALGEHDAGEDPFVQKPGPSQALSAKEIPDIAVSVDTPSDGVSDSLEAKSSGPEVGMIVVEAGKDSPTFRTVPDQAQPPSQFTAQLGPVTPVEEPSEFITGEPPSPERSVSPDELGALAGEGLVGVSIETEETSPPDNHSNSPTPLHPSEPSSTVKSELNPAKVRSKPIDGNTLQQPNSARKPLQSPIKLSKSRPGRLNLEKKAQKPHSRRPSTGSVDSLLSDDSSLLSRPDAPEPQTGSSNEQLTPSRPTFPNPHSLPHNGYMLRDSHLIEFNDPKISSSVAFQQNRSVSLPLERFINEDLAFDLRDEHTPSMREFQRTAKDPMATKSSHNGSFTPTPQTSRDTTRRPALARGKSASDLKSDDQSAKYADRNTKTFGQNTAYRARLHQQQPKSLRLRQRLTTHPSLESLGVKKQELPYVKEDEFELTDIESRASSPYKQSRKPRDHLDEKITSILNTLPGRIHLVDPNNEGDTSSSSSSADRKMRDRYLSESPHGPLSRSATPAPSLTLMPAARRRLSHAHKTEDSCVKLYHLHHGGQTAPTKLFVRTVGEDGQRVMVRVGGGWADLGEYLREYVIHHGRRKVSDTPRVEVQGIGPRTSPGYSPGAMLTPATLAYHTSGRATPSRPPSALSARPPSSLTVHKKRRGSNASDASSMVPRSVTTGTLSAFTSPPTASTGRRRLSMSSSLSFGDHSPANTAAGHSHESHSTPLGLAGPKPRSRQISMSPEGEAWVEDVLQQTRRSSSLNPPPFALNLAPESDAPERHETPDHGHTLPKVRSISEIGSIGTSRRVVLKGLNSRR